MNPTRLLAVIPLLAAAAAAQTAPAPALPDRPALALSRYKDTWVPVVGVEDRAPVVVAGGQQVTLPNDTGIVLSIGPRYAGGVVTVEGVYSKDVLADTDLEAAATMSPDLKATTEIFEADLTADSDVPGAFALFVADTTPKGSDAPPVLAIVARTIGNLTAGKQTHLAVIVPKIGKSEGPGWHLLVFSPNGQVRSTGMSDVLPAYFDRIEKISLARRIAERVAKGVDAPIAVFRQMPLGLPDAVTAKYQGTTVKVSISVDAGGHVVSATPMGLDDPDLSGALSTGFGPWLFLPPVKGGAAAPGSAILPLKM